MEDAECQSVKAFTHGSISLLLCCCCNPPPPPPLTHTIFTNSYSCCSFFILHHRERRSLIGHKVLTNLTAPNDRLKIMHTFKRVIVSTVSSHSEPCETDAPHEHMAWCFPSNYSVQSLLSGQTNNHKINDHLFINPLHFNDCPISENPKAPPTPGFFPGDALLGLCCSCLHILLFLVVSSVSPAAQPNSAHVIDLHWQSQKVPLLWCIELRIYPLAFYQHARHE